MIHKRCSIHYILKCLICFALTASSLEITASNWHCTIRESYGNGTAVNVDIILSLAANKITLKIRDKHIDLSPLTKHKGLYDYSKQATSDLSNERITSARMLRFNTKDGQLVFIDHENNQQMIVGKCFLTEKDAN